MKTIHYVQLALGALGAGLPGLAASFPESVKPFMVMAAGTCILVSTCLGVVSTGAGQPDVAPVAPVAK